MEQRYFIQFGALRGNKLPTLLGKVFCQFCERAMSTHMTWVSFYQVVVIAVTDGIDHDRSEEAKG